jgi:flagella basal body P-ring formation protein FlgA
LRAWCVGPALATVSATMNRATTIRRCVRWLTFCGLVAPAFATFANNSAGVQSLDDIRAAAQTYVKSQVPKQAPGEVRVNVGTLDSRLRLAACPDELKVALPPGATFRPRMTVAVSCAGPATWTVYVPVNIETQTSVLVLRRAVTRGTRLTAQDVEVQTRLVTGPGDAYLTDVAELSGRTVKRPLGAGSAITADAMIADALIKRGQQVTLLAAAGGMEVRARGVAMGDAPALGRVKAQNLSSGRIVEGVVESPDVIRITP